VYDDSELIAELLFTTQPFHHTCTPTFQYRPKVNIVLHS